MCDLDVRRPFFILLPETPVISPARISNREFYRPEPPTSVSSLTPHLFSPAIPNRRRAAGTGPLQFVTNCLYNPFPLICHAHRPGFFT